MVTWKKSSFSGAGGTCVEVGWKKSTFSGSATQGECVEARLEGDDILVRDTKDREGGMLTFNRAEWDAFISGVKAGEFD